MSNSSTFEDFYQVPGLNFDITKLRADLEKILKGEKLTRPLNGNTNNSKTRKRQRRYRTKNSSKIDNFSKKNSDQDKEPVKNEDSERSKKVETK